MIEMDVRRVLIPKAGSQTTPQKYTTRNRVPATRTAVILAMYFSREVSIQNISLIFTLLTHQRHVNTQTVYLKSASRARKLTVSIYSSPWAHQSEGEGQVHAREEAEVRAPAVSTSRLPY